MGGFVRINKLALLIVLGVCFLFYFKFTGNRRKVDLKQLLAVAIDAAQKGGLEIIKAKDVEIKIKGKTNEGVEDPVTTADFNSHCAMKGAIKNFNSNLLFVSEEAKTECEDSSETFYDSKNLVLEDLNSMYIDSEDILIWIDPLDATKEYTEKLYQYVTTMVCVVVKGEPTIGVIHKPFENQTFWAFVDQKAHNFKKMEPISGEQEQIIVISMSHAGKIKENLMNHYKEGFKIVEAAGAGYKVLEVVFGRANAYLHATNIKKWDICAGNAILNAVNGRMTNKYDKKISYSNPSEPINSDGVVATLKNHDKFLGSF